MIFRGGRLDEAIADVRAAFEFWSRARAGARLDPRRASRSSGCPPVATLALLAARTASTRSRGIVACFGLYEWITCAARRRSCRACCSAPPTAATGASARRGTRRRPRFDAAPPRQRRRPRARRAGARARRAPRGARACRRGSWSTGAPHGFFNLADHPASREAAREIVDHVTSRPAMSDRIWCSPSGGARWLVAQSRGDRIPRCRTAVLDSPPARAGC